MISVIALGAGVQSSTMALMAKHGEIQPMPQCAIFADTRYEPAVVYHWLDWLEKQLPFPVHRVAKPGAGLREEQLTARKRGVNVAGARYASLPYFTQSLTADAQKGRIKRQCTREYKIDPIEQFIRREVLGLKPRQRAPKTPVITQWRGISLDEIQRMKPSRAPWMIVRYPLVMDHRMTRQDCYLWMERHGYPKPPRSACISCPFHANDEWRDMRDNRPDDWAEAVAFDRAIRKAGGMRGDTFLHRSCVPLDQVDLSVDDRHIDLFSLNCETGMCGV